VFPVSYEHYNIYRKESYPRNRQMRPIGLFPVKYDHHLDTENKAVPVTGRDAL
jgi:hypothetical protein